MITVAAGVFAPTVGFGAEMLLTWAQRTMPHVTPGFVLRRELVGVLACVILLAVCRAVARLGTELRDTELRTGGRRNWTVVERTGVAAVVLRPDRIHLRTVRGGTVRLVGPQVFLGLGRRATAEAAAEVAAWAGAPLVRKGWRRAADETVLWQPPSQPGWFEG